MSSSNQNASNSSDEERDQQRRDRIRRLNARIAASTARRMRLLRIQRQQNQEREHIDRNPAASEFPSRALPFRELAPEDPGMRAMQDRLNQEERDRNAQWANLRIYLIDDSDENDLFVGVGESPPPVEDCVICSEPLTSEHGFIVELPCTHRFHVQCIRHWMQESSPRSSCPICRRPYRTERGEGFRPADLVDGEDFFPLANRQRRNAIPPMTQAPRAPSPPPPPPSNAHEEDEEEDFFENARRNR